MDSDSQETNQRSSSSNQHSNQPVTVININAEVHQNLSTNGMHVHPLAFGLAGPPPSYEEARDPANAPPPSYDSIYGRVQEIKNSSNGFLDFLKNLFVVLLGTIGCTIIIAVTIVVPVSMVIVGAIYVNSCPIEMNIPIYLIVGGVFSLLKQILALKIRVQRSRYPDQEDSSIIESFQSLISCFLLAWFVTGCFWVYRAFEPDYEDATSQYYCNPTLYSFAFWLITSTYIIIGTVIFCLCCVSGTAVLISRAD